MKLYLDQMIGVTVAEALQFEGHDVIRAEDIQQDRADDREILETSRAQERILITLDQDFGNWTILPLSQHPGVIRVRVHPAKSQTILEVLRPFLKTHQDANFHNYLVILSKNGVRWIRTSEAL